MHNSVKQTKNQRFLAGVQVLKSKNTKKQIKLDKKKKNLIQSSKQEIKERGVCVCVCVCVCVHEYLTLYICF
jgi:predicted peroxiredoxin